jgi:hypothetical protein
LQLLQATEVNKQVPLAVPIDSTMEKTSQLTQKERDNHISCQTPKQQQQSMLSRILLSKTSKDSNALNNSTLARVLLSRNLSSSEMLARILLLRILSIALHCFDPHSTMSSKL